jgi:hypothetical protein
MIGMIGKGVKSINTSCSTKGKADGSCPYLVKLGGPDGPMGRAFIEPGLAAPPIVSRLRGLPELDPPSTSNASALLDMASMLCYLESIDLICAGHPASGSSGCSRRHDLATRRQFKLPRAHRRNDAHSCESLARSSALSVFPKLKLRPEVRTQSWMQAAARSVTARSSFLNRWRSGPSNGKRNGK